MLQSVLQRNRITATTPKSSVKASKIAIGKTAEEKPKPRQLMASSPSTAQRVGTTTVIFCSHAGNMKVGTQEPPSITMMSVAMME